MLTLLTVMVSLVIVFGLIPGMSLTVHADNTKAYAAYDVTTDTNKNKSGDDLAALQVTFNGKPWYIIQDNSTAVDAGTVTLLAADTSFGLSAFGNSNNYSNSEVKSKLDALTADGGSFAGVKDAIADTDLGDVNVTGAKLYLLSSEEAKALIVSISPLPSSNVLKMNFTGGNCNTGEWWLRSPDGNNLGASYVNGGYGWVVVSVPSNNTDEEFGVRPALKLNLSSVIFSSDTKTFSLKPPGYEVTYKVVGGTWSDGGTADITETVQSGSKPAGVPTGMKASEGYTGGAWDTDPADTTITGPTTFTYTFTEKQAATVTKAPTAKTLTYTGSAQELVTAGTAEGGVMQYALGTDAATAPTGYTASIPTGTNVGTYYVWYKAIGDETHSDSGVAGPVKVVINEPEPEKTYKVKYEYKDAANLPEDVIATIPTDSTAYRDGATVQAKDPTSRSIKVTDGVWTFMGWDAASKKINKSDVTFTGTWEFTKNEEPAPTPREEQMGEDGTPYGPGASEEAVEKAIIENKSEKDPKGTKFAPLKVRSTSQTNKKITVQWNKAKGAKKYVVYGNKCGTKMKKLTTTTKKKLSFTKIAGKKVKKGTYYKFMVVALDKNNDVVSSSKIIHVATKGGKNGNATKLTVNEPKKAKATLKVKKTLKIKARQTTSKGTKIKEHVKLRYESSNKQVATVDSNGKVKAKAKGKANITVYTQNGLNKVIKVTVK